MMNNKRQDYIKEGVRYALAALIVAGGAFVFSALAGITDILTWRFGVRNFLLGFTVLLLAQAVTRTPLTHRLWRVPVLAFYLYASIFPVIIVLSGDKGQVQIEAANPYYQIGLGLGLFLFLFASIAERVPRWKPYLHCVAALCLVPFTVNELVYIVYYFIFGTGFTVADMVTLLLTNPEEAKEFLASHLGWGYILLIIVLFCGWLALLFILIGKSIGRSESRVTWAYKGGVTLLLVGAVIMMNHWAFKSFPGYEYQKASAYVHTLSSLRTVHEENVAALTLEAPNAALAHCLPGSVIVLIGESANRDHMKAFNESYPYETTPWLSAMKEQDGFYLFPKAYSNYPLTAQALTMFLTDINQYNDRKMKDMVTITDVANKAGYDTVWISNQVPNGSILSLLASASDEAFWVKPAMSSDKKIISYLETLPKNKNYFIVIHLAGSHDRYNARYPVDYPEIDGNADEKVDQYDTSLRYTDEVIRDIYDYAVKNLRLQVMTYCSDHGEDMVYFHGGSQFTWDMVRVPLFIYLSPEYRAAYPETAAELSAHTGSVFTNDLMYDTISGLIQAPNSGADSRWDLTSDRYTLNADMAVTKEAAIRIKDDPNL